MNHPCKDCLVFSTCTAIYDCDKMKTFIEDGIKEGKITIEDTLKDLNLTNQTTLNDFFKYWKIAIQAAQRIPSDFDVSKIDDLESNIDELNRSVDHFQSDISDLESYIKEIQTEIEAHGDSIENLESKISDFEYDLDQVKDNIASEITDDLQREFDGRIDDLQDDLQNKIDEAVRYSEDEIINMISDSGEVVISDDFREFSQLVDTILTEIQNMNEDNQQAIKKLTERDSIRNEEVEMLMEAM